MSILIDREKRVLVQGIAGREGMVRSRLMIDYGTQVVAGCTPGKRSQQVHGIPVYDTVTESVEEAGPIDISVVFVPAPLVKDAVIEVMEAGIRLCVIVPDKVPLYDVLEIAAVARANDARFIGPNTLGVLSPGEAVLGMIGGRAESARDWFTAGRVGVTSRSGGMTSSLSYYLSREGVGISTMVHVGGDSVVGMRHEDICLEFESDPDTHAIALLGEIGGSQEESVARLISEGRITKPLFAYIGGRAAKEGVRFSHAGAIVEAGRGSHEGKVDALRRAGATVVEEFADLPLELHRRLYGARV
jgi:succinyl-CoA synthetase alpha subunit